jgi:hypothetical protein
MMEMGETCLSVGLIPVSVFCQLSSYKIGILRRYSQDLGFGRQGLIIVCCLKGFLH